MSAIAPSRLLRPLAAFLLLLATTAWAAPAMAACGDGLPDDFEECDDGNVADGDCCSANCTLDDNGTPCTSDGNPCTLDICNGEGTCDNIIVQGPCDDGNDCTIEDFCNNDGFCVGSGFLEDGAFCRNQAFCGGGGQCFEGGCFGDPADCDGIGDQCNPATCNEQTLRCETERAPDGTPCTDFSICTVDEKCSSGECIGEQRDCSQFDDECHDGRCDIEAQGCYAAQKENGTACDDGNQCTEGDQCDDGECVADPVTGGTPCDDGDVCTEGDNCVRGACLGGPKDCSGLADQCNDAACDSQQPGGCVAVPKGDGTPCDDGAGCTVDDACASGSCDGAPRDCSDLTDACHVGLCNGDTGSCQADPRDDGTPCDDGDPCTVSDQCTSGQCAGTPKDCSAQDGACTVGTCNGRNGQCQAVPRQDGAECSDGDPCTTGDECTAGACDGTPLDCSNLDSACTTGTCTGGECSAEPRDDGTPCSDADPCTTGDQCTDGRCGGSPKDCSGQGSSCVVGSCNPQTGQCEGEPRENGTPCSDGDACTVLDQCSDGQCAGTPLQCGPSTSPCQEFRCLPQVGECALVPLEDGTTCTDGNPCTTGDECDGGTCSGSATDCSDLDTECTTGSCNLVTGACQAQPRPDDTDCDDGAFCTVVDKCAGGACTGSGDPCRANPFCSATCDEAADACRTPEGTPCADDGNPCTEDTCDGEGNCGQTLAEGPCDDGLFCTSGDHCEEGTCVGGATCPVSETCGSTCSEDEDACLACGKPFSSSRCIVNAVFVLQGALELRDCELCTCDVDSSGTVTATDSLTILRGCAAIPVLLECPAPDATTTTVPTTTTLLP